MWICAVVIPCVIQTSTTPYSTRPYIPSTLWFLHYSMVLLHWIALSSVQLDCDSVRS